MAGVCWLMSRLMVCSDVLEGKCCFFVFLIRPQIERQMTIIWCEMLECKYMLGEIHGGKNKSVLNKQLHI